MAVMRANVNIAVANTVRVGQRLMRGAMRIAPTHCAAWLIPDAAPTFQSKVRNSLCAARRESIDLRFVKVFAELNRSVARVVIEPLKNSRPNLYIMMPAM